MGQHAHDSRRAWNGASTAGRAGGRSGVGGLGRRPRLARWWALLAGPVLVLAFLAGAPEATTAASMSVSADSGPAPGTVMVADQRSNAVTEYAPGANGNAAPAAIISGSNTKMPRPDGMVLDSHGDLFVSSGSSVTEYAPGASGNPRPIAVISGSRTWLRIPGAMAINSSGDLFVLDDQQDLVAEFPPGANGNVGSRVLSFNQLQVFPRGGLAFNSAGDLFVAADGILEFAPGATGNAKPIATIGGGHTGLNEPEGMAFDSSGHLFVANAADGYGVFSVTEYAPGAHGNATPIATITGPNTGLDAPVGLAVNASGDLFVANADGNTVTEYAPGAHGNAAPIATISGPNTGLRQPEYLIVTRPAVPVMIRRFAAALDPFAILHVHGCADASVPGARQPGPWMVIQYAARPAGPWYQLGRVAMTSFGAGCGPGASFTGSLPVRLPSAYYRAWFPGNFDFRPAVSQAVHRWKYLTRIVSLTVRPRSVSAGGDITVKGRLEQHGGTWRGYRERQILIVLRPKGSRQWYWIHKVNTNARGWFSKTFKDPVTADWSAVYEGDNTHFASSGAIRHVTVTGALAATRQSAWPWHYTRRWPGFPGSN
jgi:hypothetical protein